MNQPRVDDVQLLVELDVINKRLVKLLVSEDSNRDELLEVRSRYIELLTQKKERGL